MAGGSEIELKYLLASRDDAARLRIHAGESPRVALQRNVFFDTPGGDLLSARAALRIRIEEPDDGAWRALLTCKHSGAHDGNLAVRREVEVEIDGAAALAAVDVGSSMEAVAGLDEARPVFDELAAAVGAVDPADLFRVGGFTNRREMMDVPGLGELVLDEVDYGGGAVYCEVEFEMAAPAMADSARALIERLLRRAGCEFEPGSESKYARMRRLTASG